MKKISLIILLLIPFALFSQLDISITTNFLPLYPSDGDTLSICRENDTIIFKATVTNAGVPVIGAEYLWDFDNGISTGIDKDSVTRFYEEGGGYRVKLKVVKGANTGFAIIPVKVAVKPDYSKSKLDIPDEHVGICMGSSARIIGKAVPVLWEDKPIYEIKETPEKLLDNNTPYVDSLIFDEFEVGATYISGNIDSIGLKIIHADMGDLQITLSCENSSVVLKNYDASNHALFGDTLSNTPFMYYWSMSASETMNSIIEDSIPEKAYLPEGNFDILSGCPLNGKWQLEIADNQDVDSGFVSSWNIVFEEDVLPPIWRFKDTLVSQIDVPNDLYTFWEGKEAVTGSINKIGDTIAANATVIPDRYGFDNFYYFHVINNWSCPQDTFIKVNVEEPSFTANPETGEAKLDVNFLNTTSWATEREWTFGDKTPPVLITDSDTISHEYVVKGDYKAILIATNALGCSDTDTITILVKVEPTELKNVPNVFTPFPKDGINDTYHFKKDDLKGMEEFHLTIYNRWGEKVYQTDSLEEAIDPGWDGKTPLGGKCKPGVYYYVIKALGKDGEEYKGKTTEEAKGTIRLFRGK